MIEFFITVLLLLIIYLTLEYSLLLPSIKGLPVLMYHNVSIGKKDRITVTKEILAKHLQYLEKKGYQPITFTILKESIENKIALPKKPIIISFDDAYQNFYEYALPILREYGFCATIFIPVGHIGGKNRWDEGSEQIMDTETLRKISESRNVELGIHSFLHGDYAKMSIPEITSDLTRCYTNLDKLGIAYSKALAYPYGSFPRKDPMKNQAMKETFRRNGLNFALRIGNRVNRLPIKDVYEMERIDIRGTDKLFEFRIKLKKGRRKVFA